MEEQKTGSENNSSGGEVSWGAVLRKILGFFSSMKFSLILLGIIIAACVAGSILPQGSAEEAYIEEYGSAGTKIIETLQLDHVFTCTWFAAIAILLCLNLLLCSISRLPLLISRWKHSYSLDKRLQYKDESFCLPLPEDMHALSDVGIHGAVRETVDGVEYEYRVSNKVGILGSWLCHLGMLLIIVGFALGRLLSKEYIVYGIPGSTQPVGDTGYELTIESFDVDLRDDYTVEQYTAGLTIKSADGESISGEASVNHPMSAFGYSLYQDSTGWANYVDITCDGDLVKQDLLCAGEYTAPDQLPNLIFLFRKFYPDLVQEDDGTLYTATPELNNPQSLYSVYYQGQMLTMGLAKMGEEVKIDRFGFTLRDPVEYTLIIIRRDPTAWFVGIAALIMVLGILLAFYCRTQEYWTDGRTLYVRAQKAPGLARQQLEAKLHIRDDSPYNIDETKEN